MKKINTKQEFLIVIYIAATAILSWCSPIFAQNLFGELGMALLFVCPTIIFISWTVVVILLFNKLG